MVSSVSPETEHTPAKAMTVSRESPAAPVSDSSLLWRVPEGTASVPVGGGGARLLCPWATRPGRASRRRTEPHISDQAPPVWRVPEGPEGTGGLRHRPLRAAGSRVAISRAAGPDGAQNTSEAASNKLNRKFRLRHWCGGHRWALEGATVVRRHGCAWPKGAWVRVRARVCATWALPAPLRPPTRRENQGPFGPKWRSGALSGVAVR